MLDALISRGRKPDWEVLPRTSDEDGDASVRKSLADQGDDGTIPRDALFYFYGGDLIGLRQVALDQNFLVRDTAKSDGLILEKTMSVDEESFSPIAAQMADWAHKFNSYYDGWEAAVIES